MIKINRPMPRCCDDCFAFDDSGDYPYCRIRQYSAGYTFEHTKRRMSDCPLIQEDAPCAEIVMRPIMKISRHYAHNTTVSTSTFLCPHCYAEIRWHTPRCYTCGTVLNWEALADGIR